MAELVVEFDRSTQSLGALQEAAYRLIADASCQIEGDVERYRCRLTPKANGPATADDTLLRSKFLDLVTDENLREKISAATDPVRDVILALAFGSLAREGEPETG
jgi:His-Xaa-Ser system protein HxsD